MVINGDTNFSLLGVFRDASCRFIQRSDPDHYKIGSRHFHLGSFIRHFSHHGELDLTQLSPMVILIYIFLVFPVMYSIMSSSVQILIIVNLHLVSLNLVASSSVFRIIINVVCSRVSPNRSCHPILWCFSLLFWWLRPVSQSQLSPHLGLPAGILVFTTTGCCHPIQLQQLDETQI